MDSLTIRGVSGRGLYGHVKGSPVTKGCFEACRQMNTPPTIQSYELILHFIPSNKIIDKPEKATTVLQDQTPQVPLKNQAKLGVFDFLPHIQ